MPVEYKEKYHDMNISLNPTYYCNFRCNFCYLTEGQLSDPRRIDLTVLEQKLQEIYARFGGIDHVDVYGGEVALLPLNYFQDMTDILKKYSKELNLITNLSIVNEITQHPDYIIGVSYDFAAREKHELVFRNMSLLRDEFHVLMLAGPELIKYDPNQHIQMFNLLPNLQSVEIKPYSINQANAHKITDKQFEEYVIRWLTAKTPKKFQFVNDDLIAQAVEKKAHSYSDDHIYITPKGRYAVLEFDIDNREFFLEMDTLDEYDNWCDKEKRRVELNEYCRSCEYKGICLSEHLRDVKDTKMSCNGYLHLIEWYKRQYA